MVSLELERLTAGNGNEYRVLLLSSPIQISSIEFSATHRRKETALAHSCIMSTMVATLQGFEAKSTRSLEN